MALFVRRTPPAHVVNPASPGPLWAVHDLIRTPGGRNLLPDNVVERLADPGDDLGLAPKPGVGREAGGEPKPAGASQDADKNSSPKFLATLAATIAFVIGLVVAVMAFDTDGSGPTYAAAEGIGAFALFYLAAQAAERLVELVLPHFEVVPGFGKAAREVARDNKVAAALDPSPRAAVAVDAKTLEEEAAEAQAEVDQLRANRTAVVFGVTAAIGMAMCGYLEADFLAAVGVDFGQDPGKREEAFMMAVTGLMVGGGAKGLHDTITNISKSSDQKSTPPETGGQT